ncbi:helix-turn-helix domain-containing protein [Magnetospirillum fulvum]|uniref:helix-turn-helix domain-containing protein n=1 Tax=Magnetospirillum fulvum TaxID=1082 RepID=UPI003CC79DD4
MRREELSDLAAFLAVAEERSFTRAAVRLGTSQSAISWRSIADRFRCAKTDRGALDLGSIRPSGRITREPDWREDWR